VTKAHEGRFGLQPAVLFVFSMDFLVIR